MLSFQKFYLQYYEEKDEIKILDLVSTEIRKLFSLENSEDNFR
jgi:hypothetical protein